MNVNQLCELATQKAAENYKKQKEEADKAKLVLDLLIKNIIDGVDVMIEKAANEGRFTYDIKVDCDTKGAIENHYRGEGFKISYNGDERTIYITVSWK